MEGTQEQEDTYLQEQLDVLMQPQTQTHQWNNQKPKQSLWTAYLSTPDPLADPNKHRFNHYADKQLQHLVIEEEFNFAKIANLLNYIFREERIRFTETACRQRWEELHLLREMGTRAKEKGLQNKRASSVSTFSDPYSLYNLQEMLEKLEKTQKQKPASEEVSSPAYQGYNIFKDNIREITDLQGFKKREQEMLSALKLAQNNTITDKLMHFEPYYERLNQFQVKQQELTEQKMKEIMSKEIEIERFQKELRVKDMNGQLGQFMKKKGWREQRKQKMEEKYDIEDNWDDYESD